MYFAPKTDAHSVPKQVKFYSPYDINDTKNICTYAHDNITLICIVEPTALRRIRNTHVKINITFSTGRDRRRG